MGKRSKFGVVALAASILTGAFFFMSSNAEAQSNQSASKGQSQRLTVTAVPVRGAAPMNEKIAYSVEALDGKDRGKVVAAQTGPQLVADLPSGRYRVTSVFGLSTIRSEVSIVDAPVAHQAVLNAGGVTLALMPYFGAPEVKDDIDWTVWTFGRDSSGNRWKVASVRGANPRLMLPEGYYYVTAKHKGVEAKHTIEVTAGNNYNYSINLNAGTMRVYAEPAAGADTDVTVFWKIYAKGAGAGSEPLVTSQTVGDNFLLPEGSYLVIAEQGGKEVRKEFNVGAGQKHAVKMAF